jgi:hypothetical protein
MTGVRLSFGGLVLLAATGCTTVSENPSSGASYQNPYPMVSACPYRQNRSPAYSGSSGLAKKKGNATPGKQPLDSEQTSGSDRKNMEVLQEQEIHSQQTNLLGLYGGYPLPTSGQPGAMPANGGMIYAGGTAGMPFP